MGPVDCDWLIGWYSRQSDDGEVKPVPRIPQVRELRQNETAGNDACHALYSVDAQEHFSVTHTQRAPARHNNLHVTDLCHVQLNVRNTDSGSGRFWKVSSSAAMKVLCTSTKIRTKLKGRWTFHYRLFGALRSTIL